MKNTFIVLGIIASVVVPMAAQADPESFRSGDTTSRKTTHARKTVAHARPAATVVYITNKSVTGSHLPLVVSRYDGQYYSNAPVAVYGRPDLDRTGQLNVQGELYQRDPAISSAFGGR